MWCVYASMASPVEAPVPESCPEVHCKDSVRTVLFSGGIFLQGSLFADHRPPGGESRAPRLGAGMESQWWWG